VRLVVQPGETLDEARARAKPWFDAIALPPGDRLVFSRIEEDNELTKKREAVGVRTYIATGTVVLTQDDIADAGLDAAPDQEGKPQPFAMITLKPDATESFRLFTKQNALRRIAITVDDNVIMSARIEGEITGGKLSISLDPETAFDVKKVELQRIVDGLKPRGAAPATTGAGVTR
jgi:preprotein translocase subunit SecD